MPRTPLTYEFADQGSGDDEGYNDPVRTHFDGNIASSVARESIQNIIDARDKTSQRPAKAVFGLIRIKPSSVPDVDTLEKILEACKKYWPESPEAKGFTDSAQRHLKTDSKISVLKISDYNTVGLTGADDDRNGNYHNFMKAAGSTNKTGNTGGSFGLGKGALFAASAFSTIFVRSRFGRGRDVGHLFQGKCRFMSHEFGGKVRRAVGSYGLPGQRPARDPELIPPDFAREENGTDIYILGLKNEDNWADDILKTVLHNFWRAIHKGDLEVLVDDQEINKDNLRKLMLKNFDENEPGTDENPNPLPFFLAYTDTENHKRFEKDLPTLGKVQCLLLPKEKYPNRVACFRKTGMLIQLKMFHSPLVRYAGVFLCENDKGNEVLKLLEPPSHDKWDKNSSNAKTPDGKPRRECSAADREFQAFARECVATLAKTDDKKQLAIGGLEKYLSLPADEDEIVEAIGDGADKVKPSAQESGMEGAFTAEQFPPVPVPRRLRVSKIETSGQDVPGEAVIKAGGGSGGGGKGGGNGTGGGAEGAPGKPGDGDMSVHAVSGATYRSFSAKDDSGDTVHIVIVRGAKNRRCHLRVMVGTDNAYDTVQIVSAREAVSGEELVISENFIKAVPVAENGEAKVKIKFPGAERYALNVGIYEDR